MSVEIRPATVADAPALVRMIHELAAHHGDTATVELRHVLVDGFGPSPVFRVLMACEQDEAVGYALWYSIYVANLGLRVIDLHHLYVAPDRRGRGVGRELVTALVRLAREEGFGRVAVGVVAQNEAALCFYRTLGFRDVRVQNPRLFLPADAYGLLLGQSREASVAT